MSKLKLLYLLILLLTAILPVSGCEKFTESGEINGLIKTNDFSIKMKSGGNLDDFSFERVSEDSSNYFLKIDVKDTFSLRGEAAIMPGEKYRLFFTMRNTDADPVISYSFWKKPKTSLRHYTFRGENGNPPVSETQEVYNDWTTFDETFEAREGEDSFMLTLHSGKGVFYIREIGIAQID